MLIKSYLETDNKCLCNEMIDRMTVRMGNYNNFPITKSSIKENRMLFPCEPNENYKD